MDYKPTSPPHVSPTDVPDTGNQDTLICIWAVYVATQTIGAFGVVTNSINIVCFIKQGFKDPINISLLGLAISDLGCLSTTIWFSISFTPAVTAADVPFDVAGVAYLISAMPHLSFSGITSWITAIITLERCLCIILPLKVKNIVTPELMAGVIFCVFVLTIACESPVYTVNSLGLQFVPSRNRTILTLISRGDRPRVESICFAINNFTMPICAFTVIIICTVILAINLRKKAEWREKFEIASRSSIVNRNLKVARMVVMISTLFISCFVPFSIIMLVMSFEPDLKVGGKYLNIGLVIGGVGFFLESINSSSNIFIYYNMSTKYRETFLSMFYTFRTN